MHAHVSGDAAWGASSTMAGHDHGASSKPAGGAAAASKFCGGDFVWATFRNGQEYKVSL
jgi:hypothetical protein